MGFGGLWSKTNWENLCATPRRQIYPIIGFLNRTYSNSIPAQCSKNIKETGFIFDLFNKWKNEERLKHLTDINYNI